MAAVLWVFFTFPRRYVVCAVEQNALDQAGSVSECSSYYISPRSAILSSYRNLDWHYGTYHVGNVQLASASDVEFCICTSVQGQCLFQWTVLLLLFLLILLLLLNYFYLFADSTNYQIQNQH